MSIARFVRQDGDAVDKTAYYLGTGLVMWAGFNASTVLGAYTGALIPAQWNLDFAIPLTFIALVIPAMKDGPALLAGTAAGVTACLAAGLPFNLGLMLAACAGIAAGALLDTRTAGQRRAHG